jgi:hypothetical protein
MIDRQFFEMTRNIWCSFQINDALFTKVIVQYYTTTCVICKQKSNLQIEKNRKISSKEDCNKNRSNDDNSYWGPFHTSNFGRIECNSNNGMDNEMTNFINY